MMRPWLQVEVVGVKHQDFSDFPFRMPAAAKRLKAMGSVGLGPAENAKNVLQYVLNLQSLS